MKTKSNSNVCFITFGSKNNVTKNVSESLLITFGDKNPNTQKIISLKGISNKTKMGSNKRMLLPSGGDELQGKNKFLKSKALLSSNNQQVLALQNQKKNLKVGSDELYDLKITSLGPNNIGIDEYSYGYSILIMNPFLRGELYSSDSKRTSDSARTALNLPQNQKNTESLGENKMFKIGDKVKAKIVKFKFYKKQSLQTNKQTIHFAIAKCYDICSEVSTKKKEPSSSLFEGNKKTSLTESKKDSFSFPSEAKNQTLNSFAKESEYKKIFILNPFNNLPFITKGVGYLGALPKLGRAPNPTKKESTKEIVLPSSPIDEITNQIEIIRSKNNYAFAKVTEKEAKVLSITENALTLDKKNFKKTISKPISLDFLRTATESTNSIFSFYPKQNSIKPEKRKKSLQTIDGFFPLDSSGLGAWVPYPSWFFEGHPTPIPSDSLEGIQAVLKDGGENKKALVFGAPYQSTRSILRRTLLKEKKKNWTWKKAALFNKMAFSLSKKKTDPFLPSGSYRIDSTANNFFYPSKVDSLTHLGFGEGPTDPNVIKALKTKLSVSLNSDLLNGDSAPIQTSFEQEVTKFWSSIQNKKSSNLNPTNNLSSNSANNGQLGSSVSFISSASKNGVGVPKNVPSNSFFTNRMATTQIKDGDFPKTKKKKKSNSPVYGVGASKNAFDSEKEKTGVGNQTAHIKEFEELSNRFITEGVATENGSNFLVNLQEGNKFTVILPKKVKRYACLPNHVVFKVGNTLLFVKLGLGASLGMRVKLKLTKVIMGASLPLEELPSDGGLHRGKIPLIPLKQGRKEELKLGSFFFETSLLKPTQVAIAKIIDINPRSFSKKRIVLKNAVYQMLKSGMHFGEKAIKCHPRMKNYVWLRQKGIVSSKGGARVPYPSWDSSKGLGQGPHPFEESPQNQNKPLVKKGSNVINLLKTQRCLNQALFFLGKYAAKQRTFLFVGTKKPAAALITRASLFSKNSFFVNTRWLGGMLTNWKTILKSISKIRPILIEKQTIIKEILMKRQNLKKRLIEKAVLLRKKSKLLLKKGRSVLKAVSTQDKNNKLISKTELLMQTTQDLLEMRQKLLKKKQLLKQQSAELKKTSLFMIGNYKTLLNRIVMNSRKITELKSLFVIAKQIKNLKKKNLFTLNYSQLNKLKETEASPLVLKKNLVIPNPPKNVLNKIVLAIRSTTSKEFLESSISKGVGYLGALGALPKLGRAPNLPKLVLRRAPNPPKLGRAPNPKQKNNLKEVNLKEKIFIVSRLLSKFSMFVPYVRECINMIVSTLEQDILQLKKIKKTLDLIKEKMKLYLILKNKINVELKKIQKNLLIERQKLSFIKRKLKKVSSEMRLLKFLPKLRFLSALMTNNSNANMKIYDTVQILMKKIVDPKLKYPMHLIYDQKLSLKSKKVIAARKKTWQRLEKYFGGISNMTKMKKKKSIKILLL